MAAQAGTGTDRNLDLDGAMMDALPLQRPAILVHTCCGPCSTAVCERLLRRFDVTLYFYNPNITDEREYRRRLDSQRFFVEQYNARQDAPGQLQLVEGEYRPRAFLDVAKGLEHEPEGGQRCQRCFELRIGQTADYALLHGFGTFTTTLSVSPHKDYAAITRIGNAAALRCGLSFLGEDFKKHDGYRRSVALSKEYGLYRQQFCGCEFAMRGARFVDPAGGLS
ncbi:MAG: epoxyqueuosine reductase QueH [Clostridiales Family XIII bacterium]|jgi:predicted adenine nucleotide alpha hydrolase (AANH) superfamily ATPase|nr:epoxyqueuosine reductase QueH [Clostridiales Family XIII bacterium]